VIKVVIHDGRGGKPVVEQRNGRTDHRTCPLGIR
jgi:hypothetical protein